MLVLRFFRWLLGYVSFSASGGFPERFINLCRKNNVTLWNLRCRESVITACTDSEGYKKIRTVAKKSGMRVRMKFKYGLPFFIDRHSRRIGVIIGICFCISTVIILSTRIWSIDVEGNVKVPAETVIGVFEELGVKKGSARGKIDIRSTEIEALKKLPEISWLNINISGSAARIEVRERIESPEIDEDKSTPTDIVAARDGQIVILRPFNGTQEQIIGSSVLKGDLLISGIEENSDKTVSFCRASGYVAARTSRKISIKKETKMESVKIKTQRKSYIVDFIFFSFPIGKLNDNAYREKRGITVNGVTLPVGLTECVTTVYEKVPVTLTDSQAQSLAMHRFLYECAETFRYMKVENCKITEDKNSVNGEFVCIENIGMEHLMQIEKSSPQMRAAD